MLDMGKLTDDFKLTFRTAPDVVDRVDNLVARQKKARLKFRGRKIGIEGVLGSVVLEFLEKSEEEQNAIILARITQLERLLPEEERAPRTRKRQVVNEVVNRESAGTVSSDAAKEKVRRSRKPKEAK